MENIEKELKRERRIVHQNRKYLRVKPVILIRKYVWIVIVILTVLITSLLGVYNIKDIIYLNQNAEYVKEGIVRDLVKEYMNRNFFAVNPDDIEKKILENTYVKNVEVEKVFPNKLNVKIEEYLSFVILETEDARCRIFSKEGIFLEYKKETDCETLATEEKAIYFTGGFGKIVEEDEKEYFYLADDLHDISKILDKFNIDIVSASIDQSVLNISAGSMNIVLDTNQELKTEYARLLIVLEELESMNIKPNSIDVRFERPVLVIDN